MEGTISELEWSLGEADRRGGEERERLKGDDARKKELER